MMGWTAAVTAAAALAALIIGLFAWLRADMRADRKETRAELGALGQRVEDEIGKLRERMAHLEGLLEGLRDAIVGRQAA